MVLFNNKAILQKDLSGIYKLVIPLPTEANSIIKVVFFKRSAASSVTIQSMEFTGIPESNGGALACEACPVGYFSGNTGSYWCNACPIGFSSNQDRTSCKQCETGFYTPKVGSLCLKCPLNTVTSEDRSYCIPMKHFIATQPLYEGAKPDQVAPLVYHSSVFSSVMKENFTSADPSDAQYKVCATQGAYCMHGFFGPVFQSVEVGAAK